MSMGLYIFFPGEKDGITLAFIAVINIIFGLLVLLYPNFLRLMVGAYFLLSGLLLMLFLHFM